MAQEVRWLDGEGVPGPVTLVSMKIAAGQVGSYVEVENGEGEVVSAFVWRGFMTQAELNRAWVGNRLFLPVVLRAH